MKPLLKTIYLVFFFSIQIICIEGCNKSSSNAQGTFSATINGQQISGTAIYTLETLEFDAPNNSIRIWNEFNNSYPISKGVYYMGGKSGNIGTYIKPGAYLNDSGIITITSSIIDGSNTFTVSGTFTLVAKDSTGKPPINITNGVFTNVYVVP